MRQLKWLAVVAIEYAVLYFAVIEHVDGARNVAHIFYWFGAVVSLAFPLEAVRGVTLKTKPPFPLWFLRSISCATLLAFIWFGEWWLAVPYAIAWVLRYAARNMALEDEKHLKEEVALGRKAMGL